MGMSINRLFSLCMVGVALIVMIAAARMVARDAVSYRAHDGAIEAGRALHTSLRVLEKLAVERGPTFGMLTGSGYGDRTAVDAARAATTMAADALRGSIADLRDSTELPSMARKAALTTILESFDGSRLASYQAIDHIFVRGNADRVRELTQLYAGSTLSLQQHFVPLLNGLQARMAIAASDAAALVEVARYAADLREAAGLQVSLITAAIADARPFNDQERQAAQRMQGEIDRLSGQIDAAIQYVGNPPTLVEAWRQAHDGYFTRGRAVIDQTLAAGNGNGRYPVPIGEFIRIVARELTSLIALRDAAATGAIAESTRVRDRAGQELAVSGILLVVMVTTVGVITRWFRRRVVLPLVAMAGQIERLAAGERDLRIAPTGHSDEIGRLAEAMRVFQAALVKLEDLQERLLQSQKMEAIGTMAGGVAHELNNLLHPILILADMVNDSIPQSEEGGHRDLAMIKDSAQRASDIVRNVVAFARKTSGDVTLVDLALELRTAAAELKSLMPATVQLELSGTDHPCIVVINGGELRLVLSNLLINASQAMDEHGIVRIVLGRTTVAAEEAAAEKLAPGRYAVLAVADSGCGIAPELRNRIFEPFFTGKPPGHGTGLGLSAAYGIVRSWNGTIRVESEPDHGATFSVLIPILPA